MSQGAMREMDVTLMPWKWNGVVCVGGQSSDFAAYVKYLIHAEITTGHNAACHERKRIYWVAESGGSGRERHQPIDGISLTARAAQSINGNALARAREALAGDFSDLLPCDGLSVVMERHALKGYGNAIVPQVAQVFIEAYMSIEEA